MSSEEKDSNPVTLSREYEQKDLGVKFRMKNPITVDLHIKYVSLMLTAAGSLYVPHLWAGAGLMIDPASWECKSLPDLYADLSEVTDPDATSVILWVANQVNDFVNDWQDKKK